jgi:hypothetical protein
MQEAFAVRTAWQLQAPTSNLRQQIKWRVVDDKIYYTSLCLSMSIPAHALEYPLLFHPYRL